MPSQLLLTGSPFDIAISLNRSGDTVRLEYSQISASTVGRQSRWSAERVKCSVAGDEREKMFTWGKGDWRQC